MRRMVAGIAALAIAAGAGWYLRGQGPAPAPDAASRAVAAGGDRVSVGPESASLPAPDVVYSWVDRQGVTHYSQRPGPGGRGSRQELDGSRLTPLPPPDVALAERLRAATGDGATGPAAALDSASARAADAAGQAADAAGSGLHALRRELQQGAQQMQAARDGARPDL